MYTFGCACHKRLRINRAFILIRYCSIIYVMYTHSTDAAVLYIHDENIKIEIIPDTHYIMRDTRISSKHIYSVAPRSVQIIKKDFYDANGCGCQLGTGCVYILYICISYTYNIIYTYYRYYNIYKLKERFLFRNHHCADNPWAGKD